MLIFQAVHPKAEACQVCCDSRYAECHTLKRSVSPRFVIRRIDTQVFSQYQIIIFFVQDSIFSIQIARNENHLHFIFRTISHTKIFEHIQNLVVGHVMQPMGNERYFERSIEFFFAFQPCLQILAGLSHPTRYIDKCQHVLLQVLVPVQTVQ